MIYLKSLLAGLAALALTAIVLFFGASYLLRAGVPGDGQWSSSRPPMVQDHVFVLLQLRMDGNPALAGARYSSFDICSRIRLAIPKSVEGFALDPLPPRLGCHVERDVVRFERSAQGLIERDTRGAIGDKR